MIATATDCEVRYWQVSESGEVRGPIITFGGIATNSAGAAAAGKRYYRVLPLRG